MKINKDKSTFEFKELRDHLRSVYSPILDLQNLEDTFLTRAMQEYEARLKSEKNIVNTHEQLNKWGRSLNTDAENIERQNAFNKYLSTLSRQLKVLSATYQVSVHLFLLSTLKIL